MFSKHTESRFLAGLSISLVPSELICLNSMNNCAILLVLEPLKSRKVTAREIKNRFFGLSTFLGRVMAGLYSERRKWG